MMLNLGGLFIMICLIAPFTLVSTRSDVLSPPDAQSVCRRTLQMWESGDLSEFDQLIAVDYIGHMASGDRDREGLRKRIQAFHRLYPDIHFKVEDQFRASERVVARMRASGTNSTTGLKTELIGMNISRVVKGRIAEEWAVWEIVTK